MQTLMLRQQEENDRRSQKRHSPYSDDHLNSNWLRPTKAPRRQRIIDDSLDGGIKNDLSKALDVIQIMRKKEETVYRKSDYFHRHHRQRPTEATCVPKSRPGIGEGADVHRLVAMRSTMVSWCYHIVEHYNLYHEIVAIAMDMLDRFMSTSAAEGFAIAPAKYKLAAMSCLYSAVKVHEKICISSQFMTQLGQGAYSVTDIESMELKILVALQWRVNPPTALAFVQQYLDLLSDMDLLDDLTIEMIFDLSKIQTELSVAEYDFVLFKPSLVAYCALVNAIKVMEEDGSALNPSILSHLGKIALGDEAWLPYVGNAQRWLSQAMASDTPLSRGVILQGHVDSTHFKAFPQDATTDMRTISSNTCDACSSPRSISNSNL